MTGKMTGGRPDGDREWREWGMERKQKRERVWGSERVMSVYVSTSLLLMGFSCLGELVKTKTHVVPRRRGFAHFLHSYPLLSTSSRRLIIVPLSSFSSLSRLSSSLSHIRFAEAPVPEPHTGFHTPISLQSSTVFAWCVDAFIGLTCLLYWLPVFYLCVIYGACYVVPWYSYVVSMSCNRMQWVDNLAVHQSTF